MHGVHQSGFIFYLDGIPCPSDQVVDPLSFVHKSSLLLSLNIFVILNNGRGERSCTMHL